MRFEAALVTRILQTGEFNDVRKRLTTDHFFNLEVRAVWNYLCTYFAEHGSVPSREVFESRYPRFPFEHLADPVLVLAERMHDYYVYNQVQLLAEKSCELAKESAVTAAKYVAEQGMRFRTLSGGVERRAGVDITMRVQEERDSYYRRKNVKGVLGLPWPWARLNRATFGLQDGQLVVFYARPKQMKTWLLLYCLYYFHYEYQKKPVIFTREMTVEELQRRFCAIWAGVDYTRYLGGRLTNGEERRWLDAMEAFEESPPVVIETASGVGAEAADEIILKTQDLGADVLAVDGLYFFGNREWEEIAALTSRLKYHLLNTHKIPCLGTTQGQRQFSMTKKGQSSLDDIAYGDSLSQDADLLIKVRLDEEEHRIRLAVPGIREGLGCTFQVWAKPAFDFKQAFAEQGHEDEVQDDVADNREVVQQ